MKYRKKPIVIEAVQYGANDYADNPLEFKELPIWLDEAVKNKKIVPVFKTEDFWYLEIETLEGKMLCLADDYIICGVKGEFYPCKPDIFEQTYERSV